MLKKTLHFTLHFFNVKNLTQFIEFTKHYNSKQFRA